MSQLQLFTFEDAFPFRTLTVDGEPWFVAKDVCEALGIANVSMACGKLDDDEKAISDIDTLRGLQKHVTVNESGLYSLILTSTKPAAKRLKKWVTSKVLPSIRKTGSYGVVAAPTNFADALQLAADQQREIQRQQEQLALAAPKVELANAVIADARLLNFTEVAKEFDMARAKFINLLSQSGWIYKRTQYDNVKEGPWLPMAEKSEMGLLVFKKRPDSQGILRDQTLVTGKGLAAMRKLFA